MYNKIFTRQPIETNENLGFLPQNNFHIFPQFFRNQHELQNFHVNQVQVHENQQYNMNIMRQNMDYMKAGQAHLQAFPAFISLKNLSNTMLDMFKETKIESEVSPGLCKIEQEASFSIKTEESDDFHTIPSIPCHTHTTDLKIEETNYKLDNPVYEHRSINHRKQRNYWLENEDETLINLVEEHGEKWSKVASCMEGRTGKQVRDRYLNYLRPNINQKEWTAEEDKLLKDLYDELGNKWSRIAVYLQGRTENQVKNRFYAAIRKQKRKIKKNKIFCKAEPELRKQAKLDTVSPSNYPISPSSATINKIEDSESHEFYPVQDSLTKTEYDTDSTKLKNQFDQHSQQMGFNRAMYGQMFTALLRQQMLQRYLGNSGNTPTILPEKSSRRKSKTKKMQKTKKNFVSKDFDDGEEISTMIKHEA